MGWRVMYIAVALAALAVGGARAAEPDWEHVTAQAGETLAAYIRIDSAHPAGRTREAAAFLEEALRAAGVPTERLGPDPDKPIVLGRLRGRGEPGAKPIVLLNHMDVVPADEARWTVAPFAGEIRDGVVYGRGALDMKGLAIAQLTALQLLAARDARPQRDVVFLAVPDEEVGGHMGTAWLAQHRPDILDAAGVWDEGGIGLTDVFPVPVMLIAVTEKQVLWLRLVARGPAGHGSRPLANAAPRRLVEAIERVLENPPAPRLTPIARELYRRVGRAVGGFEGFAMRHLSNPVVWLFADGVLQQDPWSAAITRDTVSLTVLASGEEPNVIPAQASAILDCRLLPGTDPAVFIEELRATIADPEVSIEVVQAAEPAAASPTDDPLFRAMRRATTEVYPGVVVSQSMTVVGTDSRFFRRRGVPAYGYFPVLVSKEIAATVHGIDERLPIADLGKAVRVIYSALADL